MIGESSNSSGGFYPSLSYHCSGCGASIYNPNLVTLSQNHMPMCTACQHGTPAFLPYEEPQLTAATLSDNELSSAYNLLAWHPEEVNPLSCSLHSPSLTYLSHQLVPKFDVENGVTTQEMTRQCDQDEIDSWLSNAEDGEDPTKHVPSYAGADDENFDLANYLACHEVLYQERYNQLQPYDSTLMQACSGNDQRINVPVQSTEQHQEQVVHNFHIGLEQHEAFKVDFIKTPLSRLTLAGLPNMNAHMVPEATTGSSYTKLRNIPQERSSELYAGTAPIILPLYCPETREEKVRRYKEKRKARKFDRKIIYNSRKASAEARPRVRGRFARGTEMEFKQNKNTPTTRT